MSRRRGNTYENAFMDMAESLGYCAFAARGSRGIIDVVCFEAEIVDDASDERAPVFGIAPLAVQVGTTAKAISSTLNELEAAPRPIGSLCIVARRHRAKNRRISWTYHTRAGKFLTLAEALDAR